ncbi:MAG: hypothetical protein BEN19_06480 [Epulopiscium sp. Nuni2H_MBin003]|nr:MAG: hypothetical protein BEN19_06480 [Epulopiscium sp. Nuni2H_MBin003]
MSYFVLCLICLLAVGVLLANILVTNKIPYIGFKWVLIGLFSFSMLRYFTLMVYYDTPSLSQLEVLRYFYLATSIGLTISTALTIWYITPHFRQKISEWKYLLFFSPWIIFYLYILITQPTDIVKSPNFGYSLVLIDNFNKYLSIAQGSFVIVIIILCFMGLATYKHPTLRSQYIFLIFAQLVLTFDGLSIIKGINTRLLVPFTLTEIIGFIAIWYALKEKPLDMKKL